MSEPSILYDLYMEIREDKLLDDPGPDEYYLILKLIDSGHKLETFEEISFAIETMWVKSQSQKNHFRELMEKRRAELVSLLRTLISEGSSGTTGTNVSGLGGQAGGAARVTGGEGAEGGSGQTGEGGLGGIQNQALAAQQLSETGTGEGTGEWDDFSNTSFSFSSESSGNGNVLNISPDMPDRKAVTDIPYLFTTDYFPVDNRHLQQVWRSLKDKNKQADTPEIDMEKTIDRTSRQGYFSGVDFQKNIINQRQLFIFIDRSNSMVAVEEFGRELCHSAIQSELHKHLSPLYFTEVPDFDLSYDDYVVSTEDWRETFRLRKLFSDFNKKNIVVMIYSDAGALKNNFDTERQRRTIDFVNFLNQQTAYVVWINPAPKSRWTDTNAAMIGKQVPMFEAERSAVVSAIAALRGKYSVTGETNSDAS